MNRSSTRKTACISISIVWNLPTKTCQMTTINCNFRKNLGNGKGAWIKLNPTAALCAYLKAMTYLVGSLISQFCIETFFLKTSHGQMFTLQFISNVLLFRAVGGFVRLGERDEAKRKPRHFLGLKDRVLLYSGGRGTPHAPPIPTGLLLECQSCK